MNSNAKITHTYSAQPVIIGGFITFLLLLAALFVVWYQSVEENKRVLAATSHMQSEMQLIYQIRDSVSRRAVFLLHMTQTTDDPFLLDEQYIHFKDAANLFLLTREKLLGPGASENVLRIWEKATPLMNKGSGVQIKAAQLLLNEQFTEAKKVITNEVLPIQEAVMSTLDQMLNLQQQAVDEQLTNAEALNKRTDIILLGLSAVILLLGVFVAGFVARRSAQSESQLREQSDRIRALYDVSSISGLSLDEQISEMLRLGCQLTNMQTGFLFRLADNPLSNEIINTISIDGPNKDEFGENLLNSQFCLDNLHTNKPVVIDNSSAENINVFNENRKIQCSNYIGISLNVHGRKFGVLNFTSGQPHKILFTDTDKDLVTLMGSWMSVTLERILEQSELAAAKNVAESANQAKSNFIANMSHEIRTPLTAILGFANLLLDQNRSVTERNEAAQTIARNSEHLHELINEILDLSKIEAGQLVVENIALSPLSIIEEIKSVMAPRAREKGLNFKSHVDFPLPEIIVNDSTRLKQILLNLCSNAIKFTSTGGVSINTAYNARYKHIIFTVKDTGIGMNAQELTQIFQPFSQADTSTTRRFGGTGLGLWISRQLAQRLGGDISCKSREKIGSVFQVRLHIGDVNHIKLIHEQQECSTEIISSAQPNDSVIPKLNGRILLAEDSPDIQALVKLIIEKSGAEITIVDNGKKAIEQALGVDFNLVLMDMQMPEMGGMEATQWLRNAGYCGPIVALTANAMKNDEEQSRKAGFDDYFTKPLVIDQFYKMLSKYLPEQINPATILQKNPKPTSDITEKPDNADYQKLVNLFIQHLQTHLDDIAIALDTRDWRLLQQISHKLKGSGAAFGYPEITKMAAHINEQLTENSDVLPSDEFLNAITNLNKYCSTIISKQP